VRWLQSAGPRRGLLRIEGRDYVVEDGDVQNHQGVASRQWIRSAVPAGGRQGGALRELLHQGLPTGGRPGDLDPPHGSQAPRRRAERLDLVSSSSTARRRGRGRPRSPCGRRSSRHQAGSWIKVDGAEIEPGRALGTVDTDAVKASWDLTLLRRRRALQVPPVRSPLRDPPAENQVRRPRSRTPASTVAGRSTARRSSSAVGRG
jgi:hypothetical protein